MTTENKCIKSQKNRNKMLLNEHMIIYIATFFTEVDVNKDEKATEWHYDEKLLLLGVVTFAVSVMSPLYSLSGYYVILIT